MNTPADTLAALAESRSELVRKHEAAGCPLARELGVLRAMCSCRNDETSVDEAEACYLHLVASLKGEAEPVAWRSKNYDPVLAGGFARSITTDPGSVTPAHEPLYTAPSPAPQGGGAEEACHQAYQAVGVMLSDLGLFDTERGQNLLDNLSQARVVHEVLPWDSTTPPAQRPGEVAKLREMLADCIAYVAARDAYDHEAEKYGHESNRSPMIKVRAAVMAAVKKYRAVVAALAPKEK